MIQTSKGDINLSLDKANAPLTVNNFLNYTSNSFYDSTLFHRVISNFMIQGGGYSERYVKKETMDPIKNEAYNGLINGRGTIAMARTNEPHSATSQFFINTVDNDFLDYEQEKNWGYAVFGQVTSGMDVVDSIGSVQTGAVNQFSQDAPVPKVLIIKVSVVTCE